VGLPTRLSHVHGLPFPVLFSKTAHTPITAFTDAPPVSNQDRIRTSPAGEAGKDSATEVQETANPDSLHQNEEIPENMRSASTAILRPFKEGMPHQSSGRNRRKNRSARIWPMCYFNSTQQDTI
jgi:hypothetical protein